jgi:hypothetical protein
MRTNITSLISNSITNTRKPKKKPQNSYTSRSQEKHQTIEVGVEEKEYQPLYKN